LNTHYLNDARQERTSMAQIFETSDELLDGDAPLHYLQAIGKMSEFILQAVCVEVCVSTVKKGGVSGAEFSTDVTFSQWFCFLINVCSSLQSLLCLFERNIALQPNIQGNL